MAINYNGTVIDKITFNGVEVSSVKGGRLYNSRFELTSVKLFKNNGDPSVPTNYIEDTSKNTNNVVDFKTDTKYDPVSEGAMVEITLKEEVQPVEFEMWFASNALKGRETLFVDVYGLGSTWDLLATTGGFESLQDERVTRHSFLLTTTSKKYRTFRFILRHNGGLGNGRYMFINDVNIYRWLGGGLNS